jgi:serine/threonine protein kinase
MNQGAVVQATQLESASSQRSADKASADDARSSQRSSQLDDIEHERFNGSCETGGDVRNGDARQREVHIASSGSAENQASVPGWYTQLHMAFNPDEVKEWNPKRFEILQKLQDAPRNFGEVYLMRDVYADELVAVKKMPTNWICYSHEEFLHYQPLEHEQPWRDIGCIRFLNDRMFKYACELKDVYRDGNCTYVVTSFCDGGDMFTWSLTLDPPGLDRELVVRPIARHLLDAVMQLHNLSIVHLDISLENILLTSCPAGSDAFVIRLIDFSQSSTMRLLQDTTRGKPSYQAPEMHTGGVQDGFLTDVFALGVVLFSLVMSDYPWRSTKPDECKCYSYMRKAGFRGYVAKRWSRNNNKTKMVDCLSEPLNQLLEGMLAHNPCARLTLGESTWNGYGRASVWENVWLNPEPPGTAGTPELAEHRSEPGDQEESNTTGVCA